MAYKLLAGAPFDLGNLFFIPATDAGPLNNTYETSILVQLDGGNFTTAATFVVDCGIIPPAGTASYNPNKIYGPNDIVVVP